MINVHLVVFNPTMSLHCASVIRLPSCSLKEPQFLTAFDNIKI